MPRPERGHTTCGVRRPGGLSRLAHHNSEYESQGTVRNKSATSTCGDLNLTYSLNSSSRLYDYYAGRLRRSDGTWFTCAKRYVYVEGGFNSINDSTYWLCTDVNDNTPFSVASLLEGGDSVTISH
ncbi:hypothetical protein [Streptomyces sp. NPDC017991]|uniref:hypothetical protein n=1 Tax=Streptomyces sp. NPDC017991 TaxID=3365026 RepID=UPI003792C075